MDNTRLKKGDGIKFVQINHDVLYNRELSLKAKGLYAFMYSKPDNWNFTIRSLAGQLKEAKNSIASILNELKKFGLIEYHRHANGTGTYVIYSSTTLKEGLGSESPKSQNPKKPLTQKATYPKEGRISNTNPSSNTDLSSNPDKGGRLEISKEVRAFKDKLYKHEHIGRLGMCFVEQVEENIFIGIDRRIYTDSKKSNQILSSTLAEIYTQLHEQNEINKGARPERAMA